MKRLIVALALSTTALATLAACGGAADNADEFRDASPSRQNLSVAAPEGGSALSPGDGYGQTGSALGQRAEFYKLTVGVTHVVNGGLLFVKHLVEDIIENPPTTQTKDQAIWGPATPSLSPNTFKFTVTKKGDTYDYVLEAKPKTEPDTSYVTLLKGTHKPLPNKAGSGSFTLDWNAAQKIVDPPKEVGTAAYTYDRNAQGDVNIAAKFTQVKDEESGNLVDADYKFSKVAGGEGSFEFVFQNDVHHNQSKLETLSIKSRWMDNGTGRSDVTVKGGDVPATLNVNASECWSDTFVRTYYQDSIGIAPTEGQESVCAFATASYSSI